MVDENNEMRSNSNRKPAIIAGMVAVVVVVVLLVWWILSPGAPEQDQTQIPPEPEQTEPEPVPEPEPKPEPAPEPAPAEPEEPAPEPLPPLGESDEPLREDVSELSSGGNLTDVLTRENLILKSVRAISALEQEGALVNKYRPVSPPQEPFVAQPIEDQQRSAEEPQQYRMTKENFERYDSYINMLVHLDVYAAAELYNRYYPLMQEAYEQQGETDGEFREATLEAIDFLLAAPDLEGDLALVRPSVMYRFADPNLEALPGGHKLMLRIGPDNRRQLKTVLRNLRQALE